MSRPAQKQQRIPSDVFRCRVQLYDTFRQQCAANPDVCPFVPKCGKYGVGSPDWPIDKHRIDDPEALARIGKDNLRDGRRCMTKLIWEEPSYGESLRKCGGPVPNFASRSRKAATAANGQALPAADKAASAKPKNSKPKSKAPKAAPASKAKAASKGKVVGGKSGEVQSCPEKPCTRK